MLRGVRLIKRDETQKPKRNSGVENATLKQTGKGTKGIIIHDIADGKETVRFNEIVSELRKRYPEIIPEKMSPNEFLHKVFPSRMAQTCVIRNQTYIEKKSSGEEFLVPRVDLFCERNPYLESKLAENQRLLFSGKIKSGEYLIDEVSVVDDPVKKEDDFEASIRFYYKSDGIMVDNYLKEITKDVPTGRKRRTDDIGSWDEYLSWKYELAKLRVQALKYVAFDFDIQNRQMSFLTVHKSKQELHDFMKYLRRNETSIFPNHYSKDRFNFKINTNDSAQDSESGIFLDYVGIGNSFHSDEVHLNKWRKYQDYSKRYKTNNNTQEIPDLDFLISNAENYIGNDSLFTEIIFHISDTSNDRINQQMRRYGSVSEGIERDLADEFYFDGFIATSQIGDFALIRRLKRGISDYISGGGISQGLDQWLFDIKKARTPSETVTVEKWQNSHLNEKQKQAVKKILSSPDVCLIQGPPGTGKTTVIAEAIFQFVKLHKRVLVASQANLAVDNALERLISDPMIRAIRLGNARKIDDSVSNITEENVLENFYETMIEYVDSNYLSKWEKADDLEKLKKDLHEAKTTFNVIKSLNSENQKIQEKVDKIGEELDIDGNRKLIEKFKENELALKGVLDYCDGVGDTPILPEDVNYLRRLKKATDVNLQSLKQLGMNISGPQYAVSKGGEKYVLNRVGGTDEIQYLNHICKRIIERTRRAKNLYLELKTKQG